MLYGVFHHTDYIDLRPFRQRIIEEFAYLIVKIVSTFGEITEKYILHTDIGVFKAFKQIKNAFTRPLFCRKKSIRKRKAQNFAFLNY